MFGNNLFNEKLFGFFSEAKKRRKETTDSTEEDPTAESKGKLIISLSKM